MLEQIERRKMKRSTLSILVLFFVALNFLSCSTSVNNRITFNNMSDGSILINFRGGIITVPSGQSVDVKEIPQGKYNYATTYEIPAGTTSSASQGELTGTVTINAGTKILFLYTSTLINTVYTVYVTVSNSDDQSNSTTLTGP